MLKKDIETDKNKIRDLMRSKIAISVKRKNPTSQELQIWQAFLNKLKEDEVKSLNLSINRFNLLVPLLNSQMVHFSLEKESEKILTQHLADIHSEKTQTCQKRVAPIESKVDNTFIEMFFKKFLKLMDK